MERRLSGRSKKPVNYKAFAGADSDEEDFEPEPKRARGDTDSADQPRPTKPAITKAPVQKKPVAVHRPPPDDSDDDRFPDEDLSESEPEESDDDEFRLDGSPSDDDSGSDFEPEAGSKRKRTTPVKKKPVKGSAAKKPSKAGGRGRGAGRAGRAPGRGRKDPSLSPARITPREQQPRLQRLDKDNTVTPRDSNKSTDKPLTAHKPSSVSNISSSCSSVKSSSNITNAGSIRVGMSRNIKVKPLHPNIHPPS